MFLLLIILNYALQQLIDDYFYEYHASPFQYCYSKNRECWTKITVNLCKIISNIIGNK